MKLITKSFLKIDTNKYKMNDEDIFERKEKHFHYKSINKVSIKGREEEGEYCMIIFLIVLREYDEE